MAKRQFNNQSNNNKKGNSYHNPPQRNNKIQKDNKKEHAKGSSNVQKSSSPNPSGQSQKVFPPPPPPSNSASTKSLSQAGKNNLSKVANIHKMMGAKILAGNPKIVKQGESVSKNQVKKPSIQQVSQALESLAQLQKLLDSYQQISMDQTCNLKVLLEFIETKNIEKSLQNNQKQQV